MAVQFDHTIVSAHDSGASATFLTEILGLARDASIAALEADAARWAAKLDAQDSGQPPRGRK